LPWKPCCASHLLQQWFNLSDPAIEEALYDTALFREFAGLDMGEDHLPDESSILRFGKTPSQRHLLEAHNLSVQILATVNATLTAKGLQLKQGTVVDATLIAAPTSTKNSTGKRDPEMHQTKKGNQWHFGMKAHAGVDADSGLVHSVATTAANAHAYPHIRGRLFFADAELYGPHEFAANVALPEATGGGGTDFRPFFEWVEASGDEKLAIYFTDGYGQFPNNAPSVKTLWVVLSGGLETGTFPFGQVARMGTA
jgi:hypothetical protein